MNKTEILSVFYVKRRLSPPKKNGSADFSGGRGWLEKARAQQIQRAITKIIRVNSWRWEIEECFRVEKSDLDMRPVYVRAPQRIAAHFFICFIALLVLKIMQKQYQGMFPIGQIRKTLSAMNLTKMEGFGYIPSFNQTPLATAIQEVAKIHIDRQISTPAQIRANYRLARKC